jgi:hypothetical protein
LESVMLRKTLVVLAWVAGGLFGLCALLYLVALAVNWRDAEPSAAAIRMADLHRNRPAVRDEDNGFIYMMGFPVGPDDDPMAMGFRRVDWLRESEGDTSLDLNRDPLGDPPDYRADRDPAIREYLEACAPRGTGCDDTLEAASKVFEGSEGADDWLLARYRTLLNREGWRELISIDLGSPIPSYAIVMDGQKLLLLHARIRAGKRDAAGVKEVLSDDLRFWRQVLESSDILISKMIASAAILRHFKVGATILASLPPENVAAALPMEWQAPITDSERSMERCIAGEWQFMSNVIRDAATRDSAAEFVTDHSISSRVFWSLTEPMFQPQDTINVYTKHYARAAQLLEGVPFADFEHATDRVTELSRTAANESLPPSSLYNFLGRMITGIGAADFGSYARRVGDLEGVRRAALAAIGLHAAKVTPDAIPAALADSELRNPYDGEPFAWDATDGAVVFRGLELGERGEHRIR